MRTQTKSSFCVYVCLRACDVVWFRVMRAVCVCLCARRVSMANRTTATHINLNLNDPHPPIQPHHTSCVTHRTRTYARTLSPTTTPTTTTHLPPTLPTRRASPHAQKCCVRRVRLCACSKCQRSARRVQSSRPYQFVRSII